MEPRSLRGADREAQILALWRGRPAAQRSLDDIAPFYEWLVAYAPWLLAADAGSLDYVRSVVEAHTMSPEDVRGSARGKRRPRSS